MLNVSLGNREAWLGDGPELAAVAPYFQFQMPGYQFTPQYAKGWDGYVKYLQNGQLPTGLFLTYRRLIESEECVQFHIHDERTWPRVDRAALEELTGGKTKAYDYQIECVRRMVKHRRTGGIVLNATGSGKTFIAAQFFKVHRGRGVFVVDELSLLQQAREEIAAGLGERVGIIGDSVYTLRRINVATVQSLALYMGDERSVALAQSPELIIILDELHLMLNKRSFEVAKYYAPCAVFGLTATLEWKKPAVQVQAAALCGPIIYRYEYAKGRAEKRLASGVVLGVDIVRDMLPRDLESYADYYRTCISKSKKRNQAVVELVREGVRRGKSIIVLVERVAHVKSLARKLKDLPVEIVFGGKKTRERVQTKQTFESGSTRVIIANKVFKKGVNLKRCDVIIDAAGMKNRNDAQQKYGRGVRLFATKRGLLYFDIGDRSESGLEDQNTWQVGTRIRRSALAELGVPVREKRWKVGRASSFFDVAEKLLAKSTA